MARNWIRVAAAIVGLGSLAAAHPASAEGTHHKIGIIGAGKVGGALGTLWAKAGDDVLFASRHPDDLKDLAAKAGPHAKVGTAGDAAAFGDVVFIAVPYSAFPAVAKANAAAMKGKIVFDASNAIAGRDGPIVDEVRAKGIGAYSAALLPDTHLVRGFNAIHYTNMVDDSNRQDPSTHKSDLVAIPLASDDPEAIKVGSELVRQAGFVPVIVPLKRAGEFGPQMKLGTGVFGAAEWKKKLGLSQ